MFLSQSGSKLRDFNPLAPHGARREYLSSLLPLTVFQSTSSSRSQTKDRSGHNMTATQFQSTSSSRSQTGFGKDRLLRWKFQSTSSSRSQTRADRLRMRLLIYFNPLAPHGARPEVILTTDIRTLFQSTSSSRSQTSNSNNSQICSVISIH